MSESPASSAPSYRAELDGLRGLAIALVLGYHFNFDWTGGFVGVDVFFVVSGYLISGFLLARLQAGQFSLREFWGRRCRRLLPALIPTVLGSTLAAWYCLLPDELAKLGQVVLSQSLLATNVGLWATSKFGYFADAVESRPLLHLWSLGLEEQFYLVLPFLLMFVRRQRAGPVFLTLGLFSLAISAWQTQHQPLAAFYLPFARVWELALGGCLAVTPPLSGRWAREMMGWLGLGMILWSGRHYSYSTPFPGLAALVPCLGAACVIAGGGRKPVPGWGLLLAGPPLRWLGLISYPLYLFHWPLLAFATYVHCRPLGVKARAILLLASILLAGLFWLIIERPMRRQQQLGRLSLVFLLVCAGLGWTLWRNNGFPSRLSPQALKIANDDPYFKSVDVDASDIDKDKAGRLGDADGNGPAYLVWGDSNAMVLCRLLDDLGREYHCPGYVITHGNTAALVNSKPLKSVHELSGAQEARWGPATLDFVRRHKIKNVFLVCIWTSYPIGDQEIPDTLQALHQAGAECWLMAPVPQADVDIRRAAVLAERGVLKPLQGVNPESVRSLRKIFEERMSKCPPGSYHLLDPLPCLGDPASGDFPYLSRGELLYHDIYHLSEPGTLRLRPIFEQAFR